jgi:hypothetical protein
MNHVVLAFVEPRSLPAIRVALETAPPSVSGIASEVSRDLRPLFPDHAALVLTDDRAPVERLTGRMMADARAAGLIPPR